MNSIKLAIMDDHILVRKGFCNILNRNNDFTIVLDTDNKNELVSLVKNNPPDIVLMDISMPHFNGLDLLLELLTINNSLKVIMLSFNKDSHTILQAIRNGASSYLLKDVEPSELENAIRTVYKDGKYFNSFISDVLTENLSSPSKISKMTNREKETLQYVAKGYSTKQIAYKLGISGRTIEGYRMNLMKKIKAVNSADLIKKAIQNGLIA